MRNQPGHFLPTILKTGIDRSGLIRQLYSDNRAVIVRKGHLSFELIFFQFLCFYLQKTDIEHIGYMVPEIRKVRELGSQLFEDPYFLHHRALFHNLWYVPNFHKTQNSHDWWYLIQTGLAMTTEKIVKKGWVMPHQRCHTAGMCTGQTGVLSEQWDTRK